MMKLTVKNHLFNKENFIIIFLFLNLFSWSSFLSDLGSRFYILLLYIFFIRDYQLILDKPKQTYLYFFTILFFVYAHYFFVSLFYKELLGIKIELTTLAKILVFFLMVFILILNFEIIKKNIVKISIYFINIIIFLFFCELLVNFFLNFDYFLKQFSFYHINSACYHGSFAIVKSKIFSEQSHLSMVIVGPLFIFLKKIAEDLKNFRNIIVLFLITIVLVLNLSITFYATIFLIFIFILFSKSSKNFKKLSFAYVMTFFLLLPFLPNCGLKAVYAIKIINEKLEVKNQYLIQSLNKVENIYLKSKSKPKKVFEILSILKLPQKKIQDKIRDQEKPAILKKNLGLSSAVYLNASNVSTYRFENFIMGTGFDNYKYKFYFSLKRSIKDIDIGGGEEIIENLNFNDASNNFFKGFVEFGIFWCIFIILFIFFLITSREFTLELKIFLLSIFISQTFFRGAGYFNGGYLILFSSFCFLAIERKKIFFKN